MKKPKVLAICNLEFKNYRDCFEENRLNKRINKNSFMSICMASEVIINKRQQLLKMNL